MYDFELFNKEAMLSGNICVSICVCIGILYPSQCDCRRMNLWQETTQTVRSKSLHCPYHGLKYHPCMRVCVIKLERENDRKREGT